jgi:hypothetical protein
VEGLSKSRVLDAVTSGDALKSVILLCLDKHHEKIGILDKLVVGLFAAEAKRSSGG